MALDDESGNDMKYGTQMQPLQIQLDEITAQTRKLVQPERLERNERVIAELFATGIEEKLLRPGDAMPEFALPDAHGKLVHSADLLAIAPLVISFFRGRWCPYCITELEAWRDSYASLREMGALLVAISPQSIRQNDFTVTQHELPFPVLRDEKAAVAASFGAGYTVPASYRDYYRSILVNIPFINDEDSWRLPLPATFVVSQEGVVLWSNGFADFRVRPEPMEALSALK
jgi:peroxiredoxin